MNDHQSGHGPEKTCPNCGADVETFDATRAYPEYRDYAGYECSHCDVRWDWEEWSDGVEKRPDFDAAQSGASCRADSAQPDPQHQVSDLEERVIGHAYRDIGNAIEEGGFAVETPRVHAEETAFDKVTIGVERDTAQRYRDGGVVTIRAGQPHIVMEMEWRSESADLVEDLRQHAALEGPCILYGQMHIWRMGEQRTSNVSHSVTVGEGMECDAEFEWHSVEEIGWR